MIAYVESSAVAAWILGERNSAFAQQTLHAAERVVSSSLTALECARSFARARATGRLKPADELAALRLLDVAKRSWHVFDLSDDVLARARTPFPVEPVRTPDALHLATASIFREKLGPIALLSFDERIRANAPALGLELLPAQLS